MCYEYTKPLVYRSSTFLSLTLRLTVATESIPFYIKALKQVSVKQTV